MIDDVDRRILRYFQHHVQASRQELALETGLSPAVLNRRLARLEAQNVLQGKRAEINWQEFGFDVVVFLRVTLDKTAPNAWDEFLQSARAISEISVIETLVGRVDIRMDVLARDLAHYQQIYVEKILTLPHIADLESLLLVSEIKNTSRLPL